METGGYLSIIRLLNSLYFLEEMVHGCAGTTTVPRRHDDSEFLTSAVRRP